MKGRPWLDKRLRQTMKGRPWLDKRQTVKGRPWLDKRLRQTMKGRPWLDKTSKASKETLPAPSSFSSDGFCSSSVFPAHDMHPKRSHFYSYLITCTQKDHTSVPTSSQPKVSEGAQKWSDFLKMYEQLACPVPAQYEAKNST